MLPLITRLRVLIAGFDRERVLIWLVMTAAICSVVYYGRERATDPVNYAILVAIGIAAVGYTVVGSGNATRAWFERRPLRCAVWLAIIGVAIVWESVAHLGVGSANQDALVATRVAGFEARTDAKDTVERAAGKVLEIRRRAAWEYSGEPVEAVQARIDAAHAHKFYRINTVQCSIMKGPETTKFCNELRQLEANKAMASQKIMIAEELKIAERELEAARAAAASVKTVTTAERADARNIRKVAAWMGYASYDAEFGNAALLVVAMLSFLTIAEALRTAKEYDGRPRTPWGVGALMRRLRHFIVNGEWRDPSVTNNYTVNNPAIERWAKTPEVRKLMGA